MAPYPIGPYRIGMCSLRVIWFTTILVWMVLGLQCFYGGGFATVELLQLDVLQLQ